MRTIAPLIALILVAVPLAAQDFTWTGWYGPPESNPAWGHDWATEGNNYANGWGHTWHYSDDAVPHFPGAASWVLIPDGTVLDIEGGIPAQCADLTLGLGAQLILPQAALAIHGPTLTNDGSIVMYGVTTVAHTFNLEGDLEIVGTGDISMESARMASWLPEVSLGIGPGQVVHGSGSFGWEPYGNYHGVDLTNHGIIQATNTVNQFDILATTVANLNLVEATGGGLLRIWGAWDNTAGEIHAGDGSVVRLSFEADHPARIEGGVLRTSGTGEIQTTGGVSLEDITLEGTLHLQRYTDIHMADIITNNGFIKQGVDGWAGSAVVYVDSALTFAGDGLLRMGDANVIKMFQWPDHNALVTNGPQHTIESHGGFFGELPNYYGDQRIELLNEGTIICEDATYNTEFRCTGAGFENRGTLEIQPAADTSTRVWGPFLQTSGRLECDDALVAMDSGLAFTGGVLAGQGSLQGSVAVGGECVIHPGDEGEIGTLDIWGPLTVNHGATLVWSGPQPDGPPGGARPTVGHGQCEAARRVPGDRALAGGRLHRADLRRARRPGHVDRRAAGRLVLRFAGLGGQRPGGPRHARHAQRRARVAGGDGPARRGAQPVQPHNDAELQPGAGRTGAPVGGRREGPAGADAGRHRPAGRRWTPGALERA